MTVSLFQLLNTIVYPRYTLVLYLILYQIFLISIFVALSITKVRANAPHFAPPMPLTPPYMKVLFNNMTSSKHCHLYRNQLSSPVCDTLTGIGMRHSSHVMGTFRLLFFGAVIFSFSYVLLLLYTSSGNSRSVLFVWLVSVPMSVSLSRSVHVSVRVVQKAVA